MTVVAAVLQRTNVVQPLNTLRMVWIQVAGIIPATAGIAATVYAQLAMGDSWRIGVDEQDKPGEGNEIRSHQQQPEAKRHHGRVEEPYLLRTHSAVYRGYTASVGRFVPGVGLIR